MKITAISDLHGHYPTLPGGDLLIVAGDLTAADTYDQWVDFHDWFGCQNYKKRIVIAGNHDLSVQKRLNPGWWNYGIYLEDCATEFEGLKIWGNPWSLSFRGINPSCTAFTGTEADLRAAYAKIPEGIDILISHAPPFGILDENYQGISCGSAALRDEIENRIKPKILICGHIHEAYGQCILKTPGHDIQCYNVSHVNEKYHPVNVSVEIEI